MYEEHVGRLLYSIDFSEICLITETASVQEQPLLKPCCLFEREVILSILFVIILITIFN